MKNKWIRASLCIALASIMALGTIGCTNTDDSETESKPTIRTDYSDYVPETNTSGNLSEIFQQSEVIKANVEPVVSVSSKDAEITGAQGGCVVGNYFYQAFIRKDEGSEELASECIIYKVDITTGEVVAESDIYQMNHLNDMEYNSKLDCIVVVHGIPLRNVISYISAETLELIDTFTIPEYIWSLTYNAKYEKNVVGLAGSQKFKILDADYNALTDEIEPKQISCTTQAVTCDDDYIYFVMYNPMVIMVYDWDGNFVTQIQLNVPLGYNETESVMAINGELYIGVATWSTNTGSLMKLVDFEPVITEETKN